MLQRLIFAAAIVPFLAHAALAQTTPPYHVAKTVVLGAPDRWDYIVYDGDSHRVYVSHSDRVTVVDGQSGAILAMSRAFPATPTASAFRKRPARAIPMTARRASPLLSTSRPSRPVQGLRRRRTPMASPSTQPAAMFLSSTAILKNSQ
jgi:hypothetical protein